MEWGHNGRTGSGYIEIIWMISVYSTIYSTVGAHYEFIDWN